MRRVLYKAGATGMPMSHPLSHEGLRYGGKTCCDCRGLLDL
jgi:hypothetical protein